MKTLFVVLFIAFFGGPNHQNELYYFEMKLKNIAQNFTGNIFNKSECERSLDEAKGLLKISKKN